MDGSPLVRHPSAARATRRSFLPGALVVCAALASLAGQSPGPVIVTVNKEPVTRAELDKELAGRVRPWLSEAERRRTTDEIKAQVVVDIVDQALLVQRGRELGYRLSDGQFEQVVANTKRDNRISTEEQWQASLAAERMTLADLRQAIERHWLVSNVEAMELAPPFPAGDEDARKYYDANQGEFSAAAGAAGGSKVTPFDQVRAQIVKRLTTASGEAARIKYLQGLRARAVFDWRDADLRKMFEQKVAEQAAAVKWPTGETPVPQHTRRGTPQRAPSSITPPGKAEALPYRTRVQKAQGPGVRGFEVRSSARSASSAPARPGCCRGA